MSPGVTYGSRERFWLWSVAVVSFVALNGTFLYAAFSDPGLLAAAMRNPVALVFMLEALVLLALLAYLFTRWGVMRIGWGWFVVLAFVGGLAFAVPAALLFGGRGTAAPSEADGGFTRRSS